MLNGYSIEQARDALHFLDSGVDRDTWHKIGRAAIAAGLTVEDLDTWSATAENYAGTRDVNTAFRTIKPEGGTGPGTLFRLAKDAGWQGGNASLRPEPHRTTKPVEAPRKPAPGMSAADVWARCQPVKSHPYITRKKLADAVVGLLRVVTDNDPLTYYRGWLTVPGYSHDGILQTLEFVPPGDGKKMTLKDSQKSGASLTVGPTDGPAVVAEGLGQASAVFSSTGGRAVACFGSGNIRRVVEALRQKEPETQITIAPDRGKEGDAKKIAAEFNCAVACLPESEPNNFDINDLFCRDGFDVLAALLEGAAMPPVSYPVSVAFADELPDRYAPPDEIIEGVL